MAYAASLPLIAWRGPRQLAIQTLAAAHAQLGEVDGPGRPFEIGRPIGHAYVLRVVAEFQAFVRDLHDLATEVLIESSGTSQQFKAILVFAVTRGRAVDRGNASLRNMQEDFGRLGIRALRAQIGARSGARSGHWHPAGGTVIRPTSTSSCNCEMPWHTAIRGNWTNCGGNACSTR